LTRRTLPFIRRTLPFIRRTLPFTRSRLPFIRRRRAETGAGGCRGANVAQKAATGYNGALR
jgi:hypothetical protein